MVVRENEPRVELFKRSLRELTLDERSIRTLFRMVVRYHSAYPWIAVDDLFSEVVFQAERVIGNWHKQQEHTAKLKTYVTSGVRNKLNSLVRRERMRKDTIEVEGHIGLGIYAAGNDGSSDLEDRLQALSRVVSPLAWRVLRVSLSAVPDTVGVVALARQLHVSERSIVLVKKELQETCRRVWGADLRL